MKEIEVLLLKIQENINLKIISYIYIYIQNGFTEYDFRRHIIYSESTYSPINACGVGEDAPEKSDHHNRQPSTYSSS